jgi:organic hydroperoxide reductase OsmC/OhrA
VRWVEYLPQPRGIRIFRSIAAPSRLASLASVHPYPHTYSVTGRATASGQVQTTGDELPVLPVAPPIQFDGPGSLWSPEMLLCAAVADCLILTFRAISRAARLEWQHIDCHSEGMLERVGGVSRFTRFRSSVTLTLPAASDLSLARRLLEKSEQGCLIANSLNATRELKVELKTASVAA